MHTHVHVHIHTQTHIQPEMHRSQTCKLRPQKSPDRKFYQLSNARSSCRAHAHMLSRMCIRQRTHTRHALLDKVPEQPVQRFSPDPTLASVRSGKARTCTDADIKTSCTVSCRPSWMSRWWWWKCKLTWPISRTLSNTRSSTHALHQSHCALTDRHFQHRLWKCIAPPLHASCTAQQSTSTRPRTQQKASSWLSQAGNCSICTGIDSWLNCAFVWGNEQSTGVRSVGVD